MLDKNVKRDGEPIVIKNNFIIIMYYFVMLLLADLFIIYALFYSNVINWNVDLHWYEILKNEMQTSVRFAPMIILYSITNLGALISLVKRLRKPHKIYFYNNKIYSNKSDTTIALDNIKHVYKSPYPIWGKKTKNEMLITNLLIFLVRLCCKIIYCDFKLSVFYNIAILDDKNQIINIPILSNRNHKLIKQYFQNKKDVDVENCELTFKFYTTKEESYGK